jgi:tRNA A-37 threonylcarbamoyl transferase component Bud32
LVNDADLPGGERVVPPLGSLAVERGFITPGQLQGALGEQDSARAEGRRVRPLGEILLGRAYISAAQLLELTEATKGAGPPPIPASAPALTPASAPAPTPASAPAAALPQGLRDEKPVAPSPKTRRAVKDPPAPFGKFTLVREIGRGGKGVVHEAIDTVLNRRVALKRIQAEQVHDPKELELEGHRFLAEARISANLPRHPNIVGVYEAGDIDGKRYLSMELIEGQSLLGWRKSRAATFEQHVRLLRDVALALDHAHRHGVIHRDIKPRNILVGPEGEPHLMDWGLAKMVGQKEDLAVAMGGRIWGTPSHMSPEHARGLATVDHRTDIWSLGILLYEALAGRPPFKSENPSDLADKVVHEPVPPVGQFADLAAFTPLHRALEPVCMRALAKNPSGRQATAKEFADEITACLDGGRARTRKVLIGIGAAALVAISALAFVLLRGPGTEPDLARADALLAKGEVQPALSLFEKVLAEEPGNQRAQDGRDAAHKKLRDHIDAEKRAAAEEARQDEKVRSKASEEDLKARMEAKRRVDEEEALRLKVDQARLEAQKTEAEERARMAEEAKKKAEEQAKLTPAPALPAPTAPPAPAASPPASPNPQPAAPAGPAAPTGEPKLLEDGALHFEAEDFSGGEKPVEGIDFHGWAPGKRGNTTYRTSDVVIGPLPAGGFWISSSAAGEWLHYRFTGGGRYQVDVRYSGTRQPATIHLEVDGANVTGPVIIPPADRPGWFNATSYTTTIPPGPHDLRFVFDTPLGGLDWFRLKPFTPSPAPDAARVREAEKGLRETFKGEYGRRAAADLVSFSKKLLSEGQKTQDDPVAQFALLSEARDVAAQAGDVALAFSAIDELDRSFVVDAVALKTESLSAGAKAAKTPDMHKAIAEGYLAVSDDAAEREDYDTALMLLGKADAAARSGQSAFLVTRAQARTKEVSSLRDEFRTLKGAIKTLAENSGDPAANLAVGLYRCLSRGEWARGLPLLSHGSDASLATVAQKEMPAPAEPSLQAALGDAWREAGEKKSGALKGKILSRALYWYEKALPGVPALARLRIESQIEAIYKAQGGGNESLRRGLVFWVEPGKEPQEPYREFVYGAKASNFGATVADSGARALSFAPGRAGVGPTWVEYPCSEALKAVEKAGSMFAWAKSDNFDQNAGIIDRGGQGDPLDDFGMWVQRNQLSWWANFPDNRKRLVSKGTLSPGKWVHLGISWDDRTVAFFIDGKEDSVHPLTPIELPQRRNQRLSIGDNPAGGHEPFNGWVGSVMIYNRPVAAPEVAQLFLATRTRFR